MEDKITATRNRIDYMMEVKELGKVPISKKDENAREIAECRTEEYYAICRKYGINPSWEGLSVAMGKNRITLDQWADGITDWTRLNGMSEFFAQQKAALTAMMVDGMMDGGINPIAGIFLSKNNYGYKSENDQPTQKIEVKLSVSELLEEAKNLQIEQK